MPLDQHIEGSHGEREASVEIGPDPVHDLLKVAYEYYNEPSFQLTAQRYPALAMGDRGGVVPLLPVSHEGKRRLCVKGTLGQHRYQEHLHLWDS